jgi:hypothetical protein
MVYESAPRFLVLHTLRLKGFAEATALAVASGLTVDEVEGHLADLAGTDLALHREGRVTGWQLTPAGKARHIEEVAADLEGSGARAAVDGAYHRFLGLNRDILGVCTAWQMRGDGGRQVVNDHGDAAYDAGVVSRLVATHGQARPVTDELAASLARFGRYGDRLGSAVERIVAGDGSWFTKPIVDSYHTVWFELHEDLLSTLSLERSTEAQVG